MFTPEKALKSAFPAAVDGRTRVLVLGSLPGERSLQAGQYYAHPTNAFWWLMGQVLGDPAGAALPYAQRLLWLNGHGVGLWDVIAQARRQGSLDTAIRDAQCRDLAGLADGLPHLRAIAFNGGTASRLGRRQLAGAQGRWALIDLPSSSAAFAALSRADKLAAWQVIGDVLR